MKVEHKELILALALAGAMIALALANTLARKLGYTDSEAVTRLCSGISGVALAWFGNRMPKLVVPEVQVRQLRRVAGWSLVMSGLACAAVWALAPLNIAPTGGIGVVLAGIAVTFAYALRLRAKAKAA